MKSSYTEQYYKNKIERAKKFKACVEKFFTVIAQALWSIVLIVLVVATVGAILMGIVGGVEYFLDHDSLHDLSNRVSHVEQRTAETHDFEPSRGGGPIIVTNDTVIQFMWQHSL